MSLIRFGPHPLMEGHEKANLEGYSVVRGWSLKGQIEVKTPKGLVRRFDFLDDAEDFIVADYNGEGK